MVGFSIQTDFNGCEEGVIIYIKGSRVFLTKEEAGMLAQFIQDARVRFWKRFKLPRMVPSGSLENMGTTTSILIQSLEGKEQP